MAKGIREKSADTSVLENKLRSVAIGDTITYSELSKALGRDVRQFCYGNLVTARKTLVGEKIHFDVVAGQGLKRLDGVAAVMSAGSYVDRAKNAASRGMKVLQNVEFAELPEDAKKQHLAKSAQLGAIKLFGSSKAEKRLTQAVTSQPMAIGETLKLFGG